MQFKQQAWRYDGNSWSTTDLTLPSDQQANWDADMQKAGYRVPPSIHLQSASYCISVYDSTREPGTFLVLMTTRGGLHPVVAVGFPALLSVVNQMIPIVQMGGDTEQRYQRADLE